MNMKKVGYIIYIAAALGTLFLLFAAMPAAKSRWTAQTTDLAEMPELLSEGKTDLHVLSRYGKYFEDRFAFRTDLITADSRLNLAFFNETAVDQVIAGKDGWLYYSGTMHDYKRENRFSDRQLYNIAHNLKLINDYYDTLGIRFIFVTAPNKNSIYPEYLPYYIKEGEGSSNAERLRGFLEDAQVNYIDVSGVLKNSAERTYYREDTHWNTLGAALAYAKIMPLTGKEAYTDYTGLNYELQKIHSGDLAELVFPDNVEPEEDVVYDLEYSWEYEGEIADNMDEYILTRNPEKDGSVYMFRDSFGSALLPFFAQEYGSAVFSRLTPYKIPDPVVQGAETVIIEKAERGLAKLSDEAPLMQGPSRDIACDKTVESSTKIGWTANGGFTLIKGEIDSSLFSDGVKIYVRISGDGEAGGSVYETFYLSGDRSDGSHTDAGFGVNILTSNLPDHAVAEVLVDNGKEVVSAAECSLNN